MKMRPSWSSRLLVLTTLAGALGACDSSKPTHADKSPSTSDRGNDDVDGDDKEDGDGAPTTPDKKDAGRPLDAGKKPGSGSGLDAGKPPALAESDSGGGAPRDGATAPAGDAGVSSPGVACNPADKTPDPKPASFKQLKGYERLDKEPTTGPLKPVLEEDPGFPMWTVYRPEMLGGETLHPILIWANGGCLQNGTLYGQWLLEVASHGFVVVADGAPQAAGADPAAGGIRSNGDGKPQAMAIDWISKENERPCSQYYHKLDVTKVAVAGQSCGGIMSLMAAGDKRVTTAIIANSGLFSADQKVYSALHTPLAFLIGGSSDIAYSNAARDVMNISTVPIFHANLDVGHGGTWEQKNGGEMGRVGLGWLEWHLRGDEAAKKLFVGADCELCKSPSKWVVEKKMLD